jgi:hypothetical protein
VLTVKEISQDGQIKSPLARCIRRNRVFNPQWPPRTQSKCKLSTLIQIQKLKISPTQEIIALIRPSSSQKPIVSELKSKGVEIRLGDATDEIDALLPLLKDIDIVISAIDAGSQLSQLNLIDAAKKAGVKRFVPCAFITVAPPGGVMDLRDQVRPFPSPFLSITLK